MKVSKKKSDGTLPIYVRITANRSRSEVSIKRYILKDRWNSLKCRAKGKNQESKMLNNYLDLINSKILSAQHELIKDCKYISGKAIKNKFLGIDLSI